MSVSKDGKKFSIGDYEIDIIVHGFPGKSVCHGSLGFSTIALTPTASNAMISAARCSGVPVKLSCDPSGRFCAVSLWKAQL